MAQSDYSEQGTPLSGYEEHGPYHCEDCHHKPHPNVPICIHPVVVKDEKLKTARCWTDNPMTGNVGVFVDLKRGCCKFVKQDKKAEDPLASY